MTKRSLSAALVCICLLAGAYPTLARTAGASGAAAAGAGSTGNGGPTTKLADFDDRYPSLRRAYFQVFQGCRIEAEQNGLYGPDSWSFTRQCVHAAGM